MDNATSKIIGNRINTLLAKKNIMQKQLAEYLEVTDNTISYFVKGKRTPNTEQIIKIAKFFDVSSDYLLGLTNAETSDKDVQFICDYLGLDKKTIEKLNVKNHIYLPTDFLESCFSARIFISFHRDAYREIYLDILNKFLQSDCVLDIVTGCTVDKILEISLNELIKIKDENENLKNASEFRKIELSRLIDLAFEYRKQHKLNLFNTQNASVDFQKSITNLESIDKDDIAKTLDYIHLELNNAYKKSDEKIEKNTETKLLFGFSLYDIDSISDYIIKHKKPFNLNGITEIIKELSIFENETDLKIYMTKLEKAIRNKLGGE